MYSIPDAIRRAVCSTLATLLLAAAAPAAARDAPVRVLAEQFWPYSHSPAGAYDAAPEGILVDLAGEVLDAAGLEHDVVLLPWPRVMKHAREEPNQLLITLVRSAEREPLFHWIGPVAQVKHALYGRTTPGAARATTLEEARQLSVATVTDDVAHDYLVRQGFTRTVTTSSYLKGLEMLVRGRVDLYPGNRALIDFQCAQLPRGCDDIALMVPLTDLEQALHFALSLDTPPETVARVRSAFADLVRAGRIDVVRNGTVDRTD